MTRRLARSRNGRSLDPAQLPTSGIGERGKCQYRPVGFPDIARPIPSQPMQSEPRPELGL